MSQLSTWAWLALMGNDEPNGSSEAKIPIVDPSVDNSNRVRGLGIVFIVPAIIIGRHCHPRLGCAEPLVELHSKHRIGRRAGLRTSFAMIRICTFEFSRLVPALRYHLMGFRAVKYESITIWRAV